jgi:hypothetical protein
MEPIKLALKNIDNHSLNKFESEIELFIHNNYNNFYTARQTRIINIRWPADCEIPAPSISYK